MSWASETMVEAITSCCGRKHLFARVAIVRLDSSNLAVVSTHALTTQDKCRLPMDAWIFVLLCRRGRNLPALWSLGANFATVGWPRTGEIDIMEMIMRWEKIRYGTAHWQDGGGVKRDLGDSFSLSGNATLADGFHVYNQFGPLSR